MNKNITLIGSLIAWAASFYFALTKPTYLTYSLIALSAFAYFVGRLSARPNKQEPNTPGQPKGSKEPQAPQLNNSLEIMAKKMVEEGKKQPSKIDIPIEREVVIVDAKENTKLLTYKEAQKLLKKEFKDRTEEEHLSMILFYGGTLEYWQASGMFKDVPIVRAKEEAKQQPKEKTNTELEVEAEMEKILNKK